MAENGRDAEPALRLFYKEFGRGRKFVRNSIDTGVHNFFLGALQPKARASEVSLECLAVGNMLLIGGNRTEMAEDGRDAEPKVRSLYKEVKRGRKFGPNGIQTGVHKYFLGALQPIPRASEVSLGSLAVGNML